MRLRLRLRLRLLHDLAARLADRVLGWRWAPLISYLLLAGVFATSFWLAEDREAERRQREYQVCVQQAAEREATYALLTAMPPRPGPDPEILARLERARQVFGAPVGCEELLDG